MHTSSRNISSTLKWIIVSVFIAVAIVEIIPFILRFGGFRSNNTQTKGFTIFQQALALLYVVLLSVYYHLKRYKVARNLFILYLISEIIYRYCEGITLNEGISESDFEWFLRLFKLVACIEICYFISLFYSKARQSTVLMIYGILSAIWATVVLIQTMGFSSDFFIVMGPPGKYLISWVLIIHFILEPTGNLGQVDE